MTFRNYLTATIFIVLLIWGPINHSWPAWIFIRVGYLILIPFLVSHLVSWIWHKWQVSYRMDNLLIRILSIIICLALLTLAFFEATSKFHFGNTKWIPTRDGMDPIGEDVLINGPDWGNVFILILITLFVFWVGVLKGKKDETETK